MLSLPHGDGSGGCRTTESRKTTANSVPGVSAELLKYFRVLPWKRALGMPGNMVSVAKGTCQRGWRVLGPSSQLGSRPGRAELPRSLMFSAASLQTASPTHLAQLSAIATQTRPILT